MSIRTPEQAAEAARQTMTNKVGTCQAVTRGYFNAPSAGDVDHDGDADAYDGWLSEPAAAKHVGDRNPPLGYPVAFRSNNGTGHGHRAISLGGGLVRSTDFSTTTRRYAPGLVGTGTIPEVEHAMGVTYLGWSETIDGQPIPKPAKPTPPPVKPDAKPAASSNAADQALIAIDNDWTLKRDVETGNFDVLIKHGGKNAPAAKAARDGIAQLMAAFLKDTGRA